MIKKKLLQGNEACVLGALAAGATFYAGYPITPSTEIAEMASELLPQIGGHFVQMEDEIASMGAIIGASCMGKKAFTATSGPGFSLMQELIGYACMTEIPVVIVDVMRAGPSTGLPTLSSQGDIMQARWGTHGDHAIIALAPSSVVETYHEIINAFNLAEQYRVPVIFLLDAEIGHLRERCDEGNEPPIINRKAPVPNQPYLPFENTADQVPPFANFGTGYRYHVTGLTHGEKGFYSDDVTVVDKAIRRLTNKIEDNVDQIARFQNVYAEDCDILLIAYGSVARSVEEAVEAMRGEGLKVGMLRPITIWPFADQVIRQACKGKTAVIVPEMNMGQLVREVERVGAAETTVYSFTKVDGQLFTPTDIIEFVKGVL